MMLNTGGLLVRHRTYLTLWVTAIALLILAGPAQAFTLEWFPSTTPVDGYDIEETTDHGQTWAVIGSVSPAQCNTTEAVTLPADQLVVSGITGALVCSYVIPEPTSGRPQWRVVIKAQGWRVPSIGFYGADKSVKPTYVAPPVPPAPLPVDVLQVKP